MIEQEFAKTAESCSRLCPESSHAARNIALNTRGKPKAIAARPFKRLSLAIITVLKMTTRRKLALTITPKIATSAKQKAENSNRPLLVTMHNQAQQRIAE